MIYIIDHQDSFTWNVVHQFSKFEEVYCSNYFEINQKNWINLIQLFCHLGQVHQKTIHLRQTYIENIRVKKN